MGLVLMFACSTTAWAQVEKGLVAHWDFDEGKGDVLHDRSGNKNHGKIHGAKWIKSGKGYALRFDGANNYVDCGTGPSLDITGPITLQAWIQPTAVNQGEPGIVGKFFESYAITYYGPIHWYISSGGNKVYGTANIGSWTHVAATFDGTTMRIFLNGDEAMSRKSNFNKIKHGKNFLMGCVIGDLASEDPNLRRTSFFPGLIDSVRVHNRALSVPEIIHYYNLDAEEKGQKPFDTSKLGRFLLEPFFYAEADKAVLSVNCRWALPLPERAKVVAELAPAGSWKPLQSKVLNPNAPRNEDEAEFSLKGLKKGTYELRVLVRRAERVIQAENFARAKPGVQAYKTGWMAGRMNLFGGWAEYDIVTPAGDYLLSVLAARIYDAAGIRCTIDGRGPAEINLNGPHGGGDAAWQDARWEPVGPYALSAGRHTLRIETIPIYVKAMDKTFSTNAYIDAFSLDSVAPEAQAAQAAQKIERVTFRYPFELLPPVVAPEKKTIGPLPPTVTPPRYDVKLGEGGGLAVTVKGQTYRIESSYSYPHGGENRLTAGSADKQGEPAWKVATRRLDAKTYQVSANGKYYAITRRIELEPSRVMVKDTIRNTSDDVVGIILSNHVNLRGAEDVSVRMMNNLTAFVHADDNAVGLIALDDLYQLQERHRFADGLAELRTADFGLDKGASYTVEWAVYPTATSDYYDFINQVRKDEGLNCRVEGSFAFVPRRTPPARELMERLNLKYTSIGCLGQAADDPLVSLEGIEFTEYPKECALLKQTLGETKRMYPGVKVMFHVAHGLYVCNNPAERFPDSRVIDANGKQIHYGPNTLAYYGPRLSKQRFEEGWRWWIFYPTLENSFGKAMIEAMHYMVDELGATGMWADGFVSGYSRGGYSYDRWDGHSVTIDPKTKLVTRKKTCVPWVSLPVLKKVVQIIGAAGGVTVTNGHPGSRSLWNEDMIASCEGSPGAVIALHLGRGPASLSSASPTVRATYRDLLTKLQSGSLFSWYRYKMDHKTLVEHMYPITVESIHAGTIRGKELIVTKNSGIYGWPATGTADKHGDRSLHIVYLYDARGMLTRSNFLTTVAPGDGAVRTAVNLEKDQSAAIVKLPITLTADTPVNVNVRQYDASAIRMALNGKGTVKFRISDGAFPLYPARIYQITVGGKTWTIAERKKVLTFSADVEGGTNVTISGVGNPY